jgi:hypothetical protein
MEETGKESFSLKIQPRTRLYPREGRTQGFVTQKGCSYKIISLWLR